MTRRWPWSAEHWGRLGSGQAEALQTPLRRPALVSLHETRRLAVALFPRADDTWMKIHDDGTVDARGLVTLRPRTPRTSRSPMISAGSTGL